MAAPSPSPGDSSPRTGEETDGGPPPEGCPIVAIGASAGGLEAFKAFFEATPPGAGAAFVLISHLDPDHDSLLGEIMGRHSDMPAIPVHEPAAVEPNRIYVLPPNRNLALAGDTLVPEPIPPDTFINLPVDRFFRSLAEGRKERAVGVILSGAMSDGALGLQEIKARGGLVIAQRPDTARHGGMPQSAVDTGMVDWVLPVEEMPGAIRRFLAHPYVNQAPPGWEREDLETVLALIRTRSKMDFRAYKRQTLLRRTQRRMGLRQMTQMGEYAELLREDPGETDALRKDWLIGVTAFFREPEVWETLAREVLPPLIQKRPPGSGPRIWIPACSSGEEAYTLAILLQEACARAGRRCEAKIFATDIDPDAVDAARRGRYPRSFAAAVPPGLLAKYFLQDRDAFRVRNGLRESVLFAVHNLLEDPPFSHLDLISCRNLLIYLIPEAQKKLLDRFHFALRPGGILVLGRSEVAGEPSAGFEPVSAKCRIFRAAGPGRRAAVLSAPGGRGRKREAAPESSNRGRLMRRLLLERFAPAAVLIDSSFTILHLHGPTGQFLELPEGLPTLDLAAMLPQGGKGKLRAAARDVLQTGEEATVSGIPVRRDGGQFFMGFTVAPAPESGADGPLLLVTFHREDRPAGGPSPRLEPGAEAGSGSDAVQPSPEAEQARFLEAELTTTRAELRDTIEEWETANAELMASNEEMVSANEELQSANEELETSQEELQSMNEELQSLNAELREKIKELESANNDLANLMDGTEIATLFLDRDTAIRRYTPAAKKLFRLIPTDVGRPIGDLTMRFHDPSLNKDAQTVPEGLEPVVREVQTEEGRWFIRRLLPFRTRDHRVDGLVLTFSDVTGLKKTEQALRESEAKYRFLTENAPDIIVRFDRELRHLYVNPLIEKIAGIPRRRFIGRTNRELGMPEELCALWEAEFQAVFDTGTPRKFEFEFPGVNGPQFFEIGVVPEKWDEGQIHTLLAISRDITERKRMEAELAESERKFRNIAENIPGVVLKYQLFPDGSDALLYISKSVEWLYELPWAAASQDIQTVWSQVHPDDEAAVRESVAKSAETLAVWENEHRVQMPDGRVKWVYARGIPFRENDGSVVWDTLAIDVTERKRAEERLRKSRAVLARTQRIAHVGSWEWEMGEDRVTWSDELYRIFGMEPEEPVPSWAEHAVLYPPADMARLREAVETSRDTGEPFEIELRPLRRDGEIRFAHSRGFPEKDSDGRVVGFYGFLQDVTDLKRSEAALRESEERLRRIVENMPVLFNAVDRDGRIIAWNQESERVTGYFAAEILHRPDVGRLLYPDSSDRPSIFIRPKVSRPDFREKEHTLTRKDGERRTIAWSNVSKSFPIPGWHSWAIGVDVTRRKRAEGALRNAVLEKEVLLREIHHRVKNNMQVISGLLRMHARMSDDAELKGIFEDCRNRVLAMALIHEALYEAGDVTQIDFKTYLTKLCRNLSRVYDAPGRGVEVQVGHCHISLSLDQGVAVGMVVSELVSNAFKHAFPLGRGGRVAVELTSPDADTAELIVADNGKGLPPEMDIYDPSTLGLGLELATDAVRRELGGTISVAKGRGARYTIRFQTKEES